MNKKPVLFIFIFLLLFTGVVAVKPAQISGGTDGLELRIPQAEFLKQNQAVQLNTHVDNKSNGFPVTNETVSCDAHLFNSTGHHSFAAPMEFDADHQDFQLDIAAGNFSELGFRSFIINCNSSTLGGFVSGSFIVTEDGFSNEKTDTTAGLAITAFILIVTASLFLLPFFVTFTKHEFANVALTRACWTISIYLMMLNSAILATLAAEANIPLTSELFRYMWLFGVAGWVFMLYFAFRTLVEAVLMWRAMITNKRMGGGL